MKKSKVNWVVIILGIGLLLVIGAFLLFKAQKPVIITETEPEPEAQVIKEEVKTEQGTIKKSVEDEIQHT
jgi:hypothetical protein